MKELGYVGSLLSLIILYGIVSYAGADALASSIMRANAYLLALSVIIYFFTMVVFSFRWQLFAKSLKIMQAFGLFLKIHIIGHWINTITPFFMSGGEPAKAYLLSRTAGVKKSKTFATIVSPWFFDLGSFLVMDFLVFVFISFFLEKTIFENMIIFAISVSLVFTSFLFYAVFNESKAYGIAKSAVCLFGRFGFLKTRMEKIQHKLKDDVHLFSKSIRTNLSSHTVMTSILLTVFLRALDVLRMYVVLLAFSGETGIVYVFVALTLSRLSIFVPALPGGIGAVESGIVIGLLLGGVSLPTAAAVAISDRLLSFLFLAFFGITGLDSLNFDAKEVKKF